MKKTSQLKFKHRITLALINSLRVFTWLPYQWQLALGRFLGRHLLVHIKSMKKVCETNVRLCFPEMNAEQQKQFIDKNFQSLGMGLFETLNAGWGKQKLIDDLLISIEGLEEVKATLEKKQGVLLLFPHLMPMYLAGRLLLAHGDIPFSLMYHSPRNPALKKLFQDNLTRFCNEVFTRRDIRPMIDYLKKGNLVWYAPDLDLGAKHSLFAPFFGVQAATLPAPAKFAKLTGAKVFLISFYREENGKGYTLKIDNSLDGIPSGNDQQDIEQVNLAVEKVIRERPEQYLWQYKRFHTRPDGGVSVYKAKEKEKNKDLI